METPKIKYFSFNDSLFVTGDSPVVHSISAAIGRKGTDGYISNDGSGDLSFAIMSNDAYGSDILLKPGDIHLLSGVSIGKIQVTWIADTSYRVYCL